MWSFDDDTREGSDFNFLTSIKNFEVYNHNKCQRKRKEKKLFLSFFVIKISSTDIHRRRRKYSDQKPGTDVMILKNFSQFFWAKKLAFLTQNKGKLCKKLIITLVFEKTLIFSRKLSKIAQNRGHNIDPWM
jgi:hypothetical protein